MTVVHWARHGENAANLSRRFSYRVFDGDLTDRGIAQAEHLAEAPRPGTAMDCWCAPRCAGRGRQRRSSRAG